ncbi:acyl-coenzyme A thioesterase 2, chloroplastic-like isoform X3 [Quercus robur]|uniref:acyl-coenzyme A thioesterase 2, chloroplastic-like isoform X3 n=1 Tax=Quercus robur TaxID=38942 RepID=UPI0021619992|nr:acyl-coenzyme A thioesterase 2, chloroplastic-like isoform X3 [Quercus robur]
MRLLRKSLSHHLFKPISIPFCTSKSSPPLSYFTALTNPSPKQNIVPTNTHIPNSPKQSNPTFKKTTLHAQNQIFNNEPSHPNLSNSSKQSKAINTHITNSAKKSNPTSKTTFLDQNNIFKNEPSYPNLFNSSKQSKPIIKTKIYHLNSYKFIQTRPFSSGNNSNPADSAIPVVSTIGSPFDASQPIDAGSSIRKPISLWPGMYHSPVTNALWEARSSIFENVVDTSTDGASQEELVKKTPGQSRTSIVYKFSSDYILREQYRNPWNEIRMGKLLEDLDALAGTIAFKHCCNDDGTTRPLLLVTASVDKMVLKKPIQVDADLKIVGAVTWVGRSSMEIQLEVTQSKKEATNGLDSLSLIANFTFVARDSNTGKSALVNQVSPESEQEKILWEEAEERNKLRKKRRAERKKDFENEDSDRLNALLAEGRIFCDMPALADRDSILIRDTCLDNSFICQPQQRNIHGRIFGGFLMRRAFELAFSTTYAFAGVQPHFLEVDHVDFFKPVDVGNFLRFKSCVLYTELENPAEPLINVEVVAHVTRPEFRRSEVSNKFYFTFSVNPEAMRSGLKIRNVVPATEEEALRVLERKDAEGS